MPFIKWPCLEAVRFQPSMMTIPFAGLILGNAQKPTAKSLMASSLHNRNSIEIHPATCKNNINAPKEPILRVADKYSQTLRTPDINMGVIICTDNRKDGINISRWRILDNDQVMIWQVLAHRCRFL